MNVNPLVTYTPEKSVFFNMVATEKRIPHPTSINFDPNIWIKEYEKIEHPKQNDLRILSSGVWLGSRITAIREHYDVNCERYDRSKLIQSIFAYANSVFFHYRQKFDSFHEEQMTREDVAHTIPSLMRVPMANSITKQNIEPDKLYTSVTDSLPHVLFHADRAKGTIKFVEPRFLNDLMTFGNLESIYRQCWQQVLWEGYFIEKTDKRVRMVPPNDTSLAWALWDHRRDNLTNEHMSKAGFSNFEVFEQLDYNKYMPDFFPLGIKKLSNTKFELSYAKPQQKHGFYKRFAGSLILIEHAYLDQYLQSKVCKNDHFEVSFFDLLLVQNLIMAYVELIEKNYQQSVRDEKISINKGSLSFDEKKCSGIVRKCTGFTQEKTNFILDFLSLDIGNGHALFQEGVWSSPLLRNLEGKMLLHLACPLSVGNQVRMLELWVEKAGLTNRGDLRGAGFEKRLAKELAEVISTTPIIAKISLHGPSLEIDNEEIDLILNVENRLIVIEAKSFITPGDPINRNNAIGRITEGAKQALRKVGKLEKLRADGALPEYFGNGGIEQIVPLVVINNPYGLGIRPLGVPVIDASFLKVLLADTEIVTGLGVNHQTRQVAQQIRKIYLNDEFTFKSFWSNVLDPFVQHRYAANLKYRFEPIPSGIPDQTFEIAFSTFDRTDLNALRDILQSDTLNS